MTNYYDQPQAQWTAPPPKKKHLGLKIAAGAAGGLLILSVGATLADNSNNVPDTATTPSTVFTAAPVVTKVPVPTTPATPATPVAWSKNGTYKVGSQIQPGDYSYTVVGRAGGYWKTCNDIACEIGTPGFIDNDFIPEKGSTGFLTIPVTAGFVELSGLLLTPA
jgi:hypothetical protein